jgi:predicted O-linked N-acetylglucosamine transferase (SPINDLY family)
VPSPRLGFFFIHNRGRTARGSSRHFGPTASALIASILARSFRFREYHQLFNQIDIALDPFPCGGGTSTFDALWMGVPVVTLAGQTAVGRAGVSICSNVGLPELVAQSPDEYLAIAANLAGNIDHLASLRSSLRDRMGGSAVCDLPRFRSRL